MLTNRLGAYIGTLISVELDREYRDKGTQELLATYSVVTLSFDDGLGRDTGKKDGKGNPVPPRPGTVEFAFWGADGKAEVLSHLGAVDFLKRKSGATAFKPADTVDIDLTAYPYTGGGGTTRFTGTAINAVEVHAGRRDTVRIAS